MTSNTHKKYYNTNNVEVPSVTTLLKFVNNNLDGWANYMGRKGIDTKTYVSKRASRGTYIHDICQKFFLNHLDGNFILDTRYVDEYEYNYIIHKLNTLQFKFRELDYTFFASEMSLTTDEFGGTIDLIFYNNKRDDYVIIDFKTSKSIYHKYFIQLSGYTKLLELSRGVKINAVGIVLIDKSIDDKQFLTIRKTEDNIHCGKIFDSLLDIYYNCTEEERKFYYGKS